MHQDSVIQTTKILIKKRKVIYLISTNLFSDIKLPKKKKQNKIRLSLIISQ